MKIKEVLIEGGVAYGNPEMEYPGDINPSTSTIEEVNRLKKWNSGRLPFEDQATVIDCLPDEAFTDDGFAKDGLYSVDLDVTVVHQMQFLNADPIELRWIDVTPDFKDHPRNKDVDPELFRKVLRIN